MTHTCHLGAYLMDPSASLLPVAPDSPVLRPLTADQPTSRRAKATIYPWHSTLVMQKHPVADPCSMGEGVYRAAPSGLRHSPATPARNRVEKGRGAERPPAQAASSSSSWGGGRAGQITGASAGSPTPVGPLVMRNRGTVVFLCLRIDSRGLPESLEFCKSTWEDVNPDRPFDYSFLDESLRNDYREDRMVGQMFASAAGLAILIGAMGLVGLVSFSTERRLREIGIRKALGATRRGIIALFSRDLFRTVILADLLMLPVSLCLSRTWLAGYPYRVEIGPWPYLFAVGLSLAIAGLTVGITAFQPATTDPVVALRLELECPDIHRAHTGVRPRSASVVVPGLKEVYEIAPDPVHEPIPGSDAPGPDIGAEMLERFWLADPAERVTSRCLHQIQDALGHLAVRIDPVRQVLHALVLDNRDPVCAPRGGVGFGPASRHRLGLC